MWARSAARGVCGDSAVRVLLLLQFWTYRGAAQNAVLETMDTWTYGNQASWQAIPGAHCFGGGGSPIDLRSSQALPASDLLYEKPGSASLGPLTWKTESMLVNASLSTAETWVMEVLPPFSQSTQTIWFGQPFHLKSLRVHSPSEHQLDGRHFDLEIQLLHESAEGSQLFTSVFGRVHAGRDHPFLEEVWHDFPEPGSPRSAKTFRVVSHPYGKLYPADRSFYAFNGSTTSPPCSPAMWIVFSEPILISARQLQLFRWSLNASVPTLLFQSTAPPGVTSQTWDTSLGTNTRPIQDSGGRVVKRMAMTPRRALLQGPLFGSAIDPAATVAPHHLPWWFWLGGLAVIAIGVSTVLVAVVHAREAEEECGESSLGIFETEQPTEPLAVQWIPMAHDRHW